MYDLDEDCSAEEDWGNGGQYKGHKNQDKVRKEDLEFVVVHFVVINTQQLSMWKCIGGWTTVFNDSI